MNIRIKNIENLFNHLNPLFPTLFSSFALHGVTTDQFSNIKLHARKDSLGICHTKVSSILDAFRDKTTISSLKAVFVNLKKSVKGEVPLAEDEYDEESDLLN